MSTVFGLSIAFSCWIIIFDRFLLIFCFFSLQIWIIIFLSIARVWYLLVNLVAINCRSFFLLHLIIIVLIKKPNSFIIVFKDKVSEFNNYYLFTALAIFGINMIVLEKQRSGRVALRKRINSMKNGQNK